MHLEVIKSKAQPIFEALQAFKGFYLAGGTALALQIGHRLSVDFDLFCENGLLSDLSKIVEQVFRPARLKIIVNEKSELTIWANEVQVTFLAYPFRLALPLVKVKPVPLLSVPEIAATKAYTLGQRATYKDYIDLYFILQESHAGLPQIVELAERKYGAAFNVKLFLEQLVYLKDIQATAIQFIKPPVAPEALEPFFKAAIQASGLL